MHAMTLEQMKNVDIRAVDIKDLVELRDIEICPDHSKEDSFRDFMKQVKNPYCFKVGKVGVKTSFAEGGDALEDRLESLMMKMWAYQSKTPVDSFDKHTI